MAGYTAKALDGRKLSLTATIRAAAPFQRSRAERKRIDAPRLIVTPEDLRYWRLRQKTGVLFIFAVDASGSMALNRMAQAKGAMVRLLQEAYIHRDKVACITFRNRTADLVLPPTRSVELAKRIVEAIPTGGATPVAAALAKAMTVASQARAQNISQSLLLLFTDGRANVGLQAPEPVDGERKSEAIQNELRRMGALLRDAGIEMLVIDTRPKFLAGGEAKQLAETLGAEYLYLPRARDEAIYGSVEKVAKRMREA